MNASIQTDELAALIAVSPAFRLLPMDELNAVKNALSELPGDKEAEVLAILKTEQNQLQEIEAEYQKDVAALFEDYAAQVKEVEHDFLRNVRAELEKSSKSEEVNVMDRLMEQLNTL